MKTYIYLITLLLFAGNSFAQGHFVVAFTGNGQDHMNINVVTATIGGVALEAGDEIAAFDGAICCGKITLTQPIVITIPSTFAIISASRKDDGLLNGYTIGNAITYKFWDASKGLEFTGISAEYFDNTGTAITAPTYSPNSTTFVKLTIDAPVNQTPVSNAGPDQAVNEGGNVILDGSASFDADANPLTYAWTSPPGIILSSTSVAKPTFTAPNVTTDTQYTFSLIVNDGLVNSGTDQVVITVKKVNIIPLANAGVDQTVNEGVIVTLNGTASSDPDSDPLTYLWTSPTVITLSSNTSTQPTFTAPEVNSDTQYTFSLVVNDGTVNSTIDQVIITVKQVNKAPVANAGTDQSVNENIQYMLDGSTSSDPDGDALTYKWTAPTGITLSSLSAAKPTFTAPDVTANTNYTFTLVVNDGKVDSPEDQVTITVKQGNLAPNANAGVDQTINEGVIVTLNGTASSDPDSDPLTYLWTSPTVITLSSNTSSQPTFTAPEVTSDNQYTFSLVVNDGTVNSTLDQVIITVKQINKAPVANAGTDQSVNENIQYMLDGSTSSDPDGDALTYKWTAPTGITLSSLSAAKPTFTAPDVTANTNYTFTLVVNDGKVDSPADQVTITVKQENQSPTANAGSDQAVNEGATVTLNGTASSDPDSDPLTYLWTPPAGITLSSNTSSQPTFTAPEVTANMQYTFSLVVNDGFAESLPDDILVIVRNVDHTPYVKDPIKNVSVDKGTPDQMIDLKTIFSDDDPGDVLIYSITSNTNDQVVKATIAGSNLTLSFSKVNIGSSEIVISASSNGKEVNSKFEVEVKIPTGTNPMIIEQNLLVYPNPTSGKIKVVFNQMPKTDILMTITNVNGIPVFEKLIQNKEESIDLSGNLPGVYLIKTDLDNIKVHKLVIQ